MIGSSLAQHRGFMKKRKGLGVTFERDERGKYRVGMKKFEGS